MTPFFSFQKNKNFFKRIAFAVAIFAIFGFSSDAALAAITAGSDGDVYDVQKLHFRPSVGGTKYLFEYVAPDTTAGIIGGINLSNVTDTAGLNFDIFGAVGANLLKVFGGTSNGIIQWNDTAGKFQWKVEGGTLQDFGGSITGGTCGTGFVTAVSATGAVTCVAESDPTVSAWAKAATKPAYGFSEITGSVTDAQVPDDITITESDTVFLAQKGQANGVATLGADSKVPSSQLPKLVITDVLVQPLSAVDTAGERATLEIEQGDVIIDTAANKTYIWSGTEWKEIIAPNTVTSVNGETGTVSLSLDSLSDVDVATCTLNNVLKWSDTGWVCATDSDSDVWSAITGGIKYGGGKVGIGAGITDAEIISPLTVKGDVAAGSFTTAGTVDAGGIIASGGARFPRQAGTSVTPGRGPSISLESPSNNVTTSKGTPDLCNEINECASDNTPSGNVDTEYVCPTGSGGLSYSKDVYQDASFNRWHQTITCVAGTDTYSLSANAGALEFTNTSGDVKLKLAQNGNVSFFGSLIIPGGTAGQVLTKQTDGTASWQPSSSGADQWGTQVVQRDASLKGNGTTATPLGLMACSSNGQVLKWNSTTSSWGCDTDNAGGGSVWSSPDANGRISYTGGNVGIGTAGPTGVLHINPLRSFSGQDLDSTNRTRITGFPSGHDVQIGDMIKITAGDNDWHVVVGRESDYADISTSDPFDAVFSDAASYSLQKNVVLGGGNTYAGTIDVNKVDANTVQIRTGAAAGKFLKSVDTSGNAVWDAVPPAYADANVETWVEGRMVDGDFSASPATAKIKSSLLPALAITNTFPIATADSDTQAKCQNAVVALSAANEGDVAICAGINKTYILTVENGRATFGNWSEIKAPNQVTSVNGQTGAVSLNLNTDDADANPTNEAQTLTYTDSTRAVNLTAVGTTGGGTTGGGSFTLPQGSKWADNVAPAITGINYTGGNVGIGTAGPGAKLHINNEVTDRTGGIELSNNGAFYKYYISAPLGSNNLIIDANGDTDGRQGSTNNGTGNIVFETAAGSAVGGTGASTEKMRITSVGNVGIGGSADGKLSVYVPANSRGIESLTSTAGNTHLPWFDNWNYISGNGVIFRNASNQEKMRIDALNGNVGIGTASPDGKLDVMSTVEGLITGLRFYGVHSPGVYAGGVIDSYDDGGTVRQLMLQLNGGNVGIGTASPGAKLDVAGAINLSSNTAGTASQFWLGRGGAIAGGTTAMYAPSGSGLEFGIANAAKMVMDSNGNVGIGTASPQTKLVVSNGGTQNIEIDPGFIQSFNRTTPGYAPMPFYASVYSFNGGNVGIGTASPSAGAKLDIAGTTRTNGFNATGNAFFEGKVGIGTSEPATALSVRDGDITIQNRFRLPTEGATVYVYRGYAAGHVTTATIINADGTTANVSGAQFSGDTTPIQEHNTTVTYPSGGDGIGTVRFDWYQEESGAINKSAIWRVEQLSAQDPTPARGVVFNDLNSPTSFWSLKNINGTFRFLNGSNASKLSISQTGDLTIGGGLNALGDILNVKSITASGIIKNTGGEMTSEGTGAGYSFSSRGAGGNAERWVLYAPNDTTVALWTNGADKFTVSDTGDVSAASISIVGGTVSKIRYMNLGEDTYGTNSNANGRDTCNTDGNIQYTCAADETKSCTDNYGDPNYTYVQKRVVTCVANYVLSNN